jgi:putative flippase GtrA
MSLNDPQCGTSNVRPIAIFTSYILLCLALTIFILRTLYLKSTLKPSFSTTSKQQTRYVSSAQIVKHVKLFAAFAILSLGTTWYYMLCFFSLSYRSWAFTHVAALGGDRQQLGLWLKETQLFKEAWGTAVATPARFWWTQQVFLFSAAWSMFLGREGTNFPYD